MEILSPAPVEGSSEASLLTCRSDGAEVEVTVSVLPCPEDGRQFSVAVEARRIVASGTAVSQEQLHVVSPFAGWHPQRTLRAEFSFSGPAGQHTAALENPTLVHDTLSQIIFVSRGVHEQDGVARTRFNAVGDLPTGPVGLRVTWADFGLDVTTSFDARILTSRTSPLPTAAPRPAPSPAPQRGASRG